MKKLCSLLLGLVMTSAMSMRAAAPVTHADLAYFWSDACGTSYRPGQLRSFVLGTLYPDIRFLFDFPRESTHPTDVSLNGILHEKSPFVAGARFHAWVDDLRESYMAMPNDEGVINKEGKVISRKKFLEGQLDIPARNRGAFLKYVEDEIYFPLRNWSQVAQDMENLAQVGHGSEEQNAIRIWYRLIKGQFENPPSEFFRQLAEENKGYLGLVPSQLKDWAEKLPKYAQQPRFQEHAKNMRAFFKNKINDCLSTETYKWEGIARTPAWYEQVVTWLPKSVQNVVIGLANKVGV